MIGSAFYALGGFSLVVLATMEYFAGLLGCEIIASLVSPRLASLLGVASLCVPLITAI